VIAKNTREPGIYSPMKILFYFGHPAQYLFLRETIRNLIKNEGTSVVILIKTKDVLEELIKTDGFEYKNILPKERGKTKAAVIFSFIKRLFIILPILLKEKPSLLVSTDAPAAILGKLLGIHRITITEDDYEVIKDLAGLTYPFTETILCPFVCSVGKYEDKKIGYEGYMKLGYLHPNVFTPDSEILTKYDIAPRFVLIRLARLTAFHDFGVSGLAVNTLDQLIDISEKHQFPVYISSEDELHPKYHRYLLKIVPSDMHHILANAALLISDSQSMSVEAAILGTPSLRFSSFAGKISVLEELEHKYGLTWGIDPSSVEILFHNIEELLQKKDLKPIQEEKRWKMLADKIDVTAFLTWFLPNYPNSREIIKENPSYQYRFSQLENSPLKKH